MRKWQIKISDLKRNMQVNCIPEAIFDFEIDNYEQFLIERRILMSKKIKSYYYGNEEPEIERTLITPNNPFTNKLIFLNTLEKCEGFIHWVDKYFSSKGLELLSESVSNKVKDIKIIMAVDKVDESIRSNFKNFREEMKNRGIKAELNVIIDSKTKSSIHDRFILSKYEAFNIPSPDVVARGQLSEISISSNKDNLLTQFNNLWKNSKDIIQEWNEIKSKMVK